MIMPLKQLREKAKLTQADLGKKLNIAPSTVGMWEKGYRSPDYDMLKRIADYFNVSTDYLLEHDSPEVCSLSADQKKVLKVFDMLSEDGKNLFMGMLNSLSMSHVKTKTKAVGVVNSGGSNYGVVGGNFSANVTMA